MVYNNLQDTLTRRSLLSTAGYKEPGVTLGHNILHHSGLLLHTYVCCSETTLLFIWNVARYEPLPDYVQMVSHAYINTVGHAGPKSRHIHWRFEHEKEGVYL